MMASLHIAVLFGNEKLTRSLLEEGYDVNTYDQRLGTPLSIAILKGYRSIVKLLSEHGADHNDERFTSSLIDSTIDEFKLSATFETSGAAAGSEAEASKLQADQNAPTLPQNDVTDDHDDDSLADLDSTASGEGMIGSKSLVKTYFRNDHKWEETPAGIETALNFDPTEVIEQAYKAYAIVEFRETDSEGDWFTSSIEINGPKLCGFISMVLEEYPGASHPRSRATLLLANITMERFDPNFIGLFHRKERYAKLLEEETDSTTKRQAELLLQLLQTLWRPLNNSLEEFGDTGLITWPQLWSIYEPGKIAIISSGDNDNDNELQATRIKEITMTTEGRWRETQFYRLKLEMVDWNGSYTGYKQVVYGIPRYDGLQRVTDHSVFPLQLHSSPQTLKEMLVERGRKFESLRGYKFMARKEFNLTRVSKLFFIPLSPFFFGYLLKSGIALCSESSSTTTHTTDSKTVAFLHTSDLAMEKRLGHTFKILILTTTYLS